MAHSWLNDARDWMSTVPDALADRLRVDTATELCAGDLDVDLDARSLAWVRSQPRCTACEACDAYCPKLPTAKLTQFAGPMELALRVVPSLPDLRDAIDLIAAFDDCQGCQLCDQRCPQQIPLTEIAARLRPAIQRQLESRESARQALAEIQASQGR